MSEKIKLNSGFHGRPKNGGDWDLGKKWGGLRITLLHTYKKEIERWAKQSGMAKASFYRMAFMRGSLAMAKDLGFAEEFSPIVDDPKVAT